MGRAPIRIARLKLASGPVETFERPDAALPYGGGEMALFALALFLSAALLFTVEPMFAKMVLPLLGGAPAVWNACLVYYQATLLAGYLYAHLSLKWLGPRRQAVLHLAVLGLAWVALPIRVAAGWLPPPSIFPAPWLWMLLTASLGLPLLAISASAPMLQAWFAQTRGQGRRDPYFLYAASNLGSLAALLAYPLVIEGSIRLTQQTIGWAIGYGLLMALIAACAARLWLRPSAPSRDRAERKQFLRRAPLAERAEKGTPTAAHRLRWLALSLVPSSLLMGVTTYISNEIAPQPLLWVVPLALYLLTFVLVFAPRTILPLRWMVAVQPPLIVVVAATLLCSGSGLLEVVLFGTLHLVTFFVTAMVCHGQMAADRPEPGRLTEFYLWMSLGGVLGGLFNALVAPLIFNSVLEYPLMLAAACLLRPRGLVEAGSPATAANEPANRLLRWRREGLILPTVALLLCLVVAWGLRFDGFLSGLRFSDSMLMRVAVLGLASLSAFLLRRRPTLFCFAVAALAAASLWSLETGTKLLLAQRSFFGILRVERDTAWNANQLLHGTTNHGQQSLETSQRREPQGYDHRSGPLGAIFAALQPRRPLAEVGVLGLGVGAIAAYAQPGERFTFFEIDPAVEQIARNTDYFTYLADCRGKVDVVLGNARLSLEHGPQRTFDLLIVDVFSSDTVPVHLITREAFEIYRHRLRPHGLLAIHISSRYYDLEPVLGNLAEDAGLTARLWRETAACRPFGSFPPPGWRWLSAARISIHWRSISVGSRWPARRSRSGPTTSPMSPERCAGRRADCT